MRTINWLREEGLALFVISSELDEVVAEASGNPFRRAASAICEFGVAVSVLAMLTPDRSAPPAGLAGAQAQDYATLVAAIDSGRPENAVAAMTRIARIG